MNNEQKTLNNGHGTVGREQWREVKIELPLGCRILSLKPCHAKKDNLKKGGQKIKGPLAQEQGATSQEQRLFPSLQWRQGLAKTFDNHRQRLPIVYSLRA